MIDLQQLLLPVPGSFACGADLEDDAVAATDPAVIAQQAALFQLDALYTEARRADAEDASWLAVLNGAAEFLQVNKHLRVAVYLCDAAMRRQKLRGLALGLAAVHGICEAFWNELHPLASTPGGRQARVNILSGLGGNHFLAALRNMQLVEGTGATLKSFEATLAPGAAADDAAAGKFARSELAGCPKDQLDEALQLAGQALEHARWIVARVDAEYSPDDAVDCGEFLSGVDGKLVKQLETICRILSHATGSPADATAVPAATGVAGAGVPAALAPAPGTFTKDRIRPMLDQIIDYYQEHEPSSPVPLLLLRAKRLMDLGFIDLLNDTVGDDAARKAQQILGLGKEGG